MCFDRWSGGSMWCSCLAGSVEDEASYTCIVEATPKQGEQPCSKTNQHLTKRKQNKCENSGDAFTCMEVKWKVQPGGCTCSGHMKKPQTEKDVWKQPSPKQCTKGLYSACVSSRCVYVPFPPILTQTSFKAHCSESNGATHASRLA